MPPLPQTQLRCQLHRLIGANRHSAQPDGRLLERFLAEQDEAAFEALVHRHGPLVWGVCQRVLRHAHDSEDVFQATFLLLIRRVRSIDRHAALGAWLYRVAYRLALEAKARAARRARLERGETDAAARESTASPPVDAIRKELRCVLDEEIARLPRKYREPVILCYFAGKTYDEAARELACPKGTLSIRLTRARELLRARLVRRGLAVSAGTVASLLSQEIPRGAASGPLARSAIRTAHWSVGGGAAARSEIPERVLQLMEGVSKAMFFARIHFAVVVLAVVGTVAGLWAYTARAGSPGDQAQRVTAPAGAAGSAAATAGPVARPLGTWERRVGPYRVTLRVEADRLYGTLLGTPGDKPLVATMEAEYGVTADGVLYGVLGNVECAGVRSAGVKASGYIDQPFSVHFRVDDGTLTVKALKFMGGQGGEIGEAIQGRYTRASAARQLVRDERVRVIGDEAPAEPPDEATVLRALPRPALDGTGGVRVYRDDVQVVCERLAHRLDRPRLYPLVGRARLEHCHWKCTVYFNETAKADYPFPFRTKRPRVEVVYIDEEYLRLAP